MDIVWIRSVGFRLANNRLIIRIGELELVVEPCKFLELADLGSDQSEMIMTEEGKIVVTREGESVHITIFLTGDSLRLSEASLSVAEWSDLHDQLSPCKDDEAVAA